MPRKTKEELLSQLKPILGDNTSPEVLSFLEDFEDSYATDVTDLNNRIAELEAKNKEIEDSWAKKYRDRFFDYAETPVDPDPQIDIVDDAQESEGEPEEEIPSVDELADMF